MGGRCNGYENHRIYSIYIISGIKKVPGGGRGNTKKTGRRQEGVSRGFDIREAEAIAYGRLLLKPWEFDRYTIPEWFLALKGYREAREEEYRNTFDAARFIATMNINKNLKRGQQKTPQQMFPMPWDGKGYFTGDLTKEERKRIQAKLRSKEWMEAIPTKQKNG